MSPEKNLHHAHELDQWVVWFKKEFAPADLNASGVLAYLHHFVDLGILESSANKGRWKLAGIDNDSKPEDIREKVLDRLETLSETTAGFAVNFFLGRQPDISSASQEKATPVRKNNPKVNEYSPNLEKASDLSNLQIVKKVGRQLQPFLEFEKKTVSRLIGNHTQQKEARVIFNFILRHTRTKAEPKKWEQLSRKRHK
jgi:hypothetical protein